MKFSFNEIFGDEYTLLSAEYINSKTPVIVRHNKCGHIFYPTPNNLLSKKTGYPKCANNLLLSQEDFERKVKEKYGDDYIILSKYTGLKNKIKVRHKCGNIFEIIAESLLYENKNGGCHECAHMKFLERS